MIGLLGDLLSPCNEHLAAMGEALLDCMHNLHLNAGNSGFRAKPRDSPRAIVPQVTIGVCA